MCSRPKCPKSPVCMQRKRPLRPSSSSILCPPLSITPSPPLLTFEMGFTSFHQFASLWSLLCLRYLQLHSSIEGETGKSWGRTLSCRRAFWWRPVAMSVSMSVGGQGAFCFRHRLHAEPPLIHHKLKYYLLFFTVKKTLLETSLTSMNPFFF